MHKIRSNCVAAGVAGVLRSACRIWPAAGNATAHSHHPPAPALPPHRNQRVLAAVHRNTNLCYIYSRRRSAPPWAATAQLRHASSPSPWPAADLTGGSNRVSAPRMNVRRVDSYIFKNADFRRIPELALRERTTSDAVRTNQ